MVATPLEKQIIIRRAVKKDLPSLEWEGEFSHFRHMFAEAYRLQELGDVLMWVIELPEFGLIGQLFIQLYGPDQIQNTKTRYAYIYGFRIRPDYRGLGIGSRLLRSGRIEY